jgi:hypothetical protein
MGYSSTTSLLPAVESSSKRTKLQHSTSCQRSPASAREEEIYASNDDIPERTSDFGSLKGVGAFTTFEHFLSDLTLLSPDITCSVNGDEKGPNPGLFLFLFFFT